VALPSPPHRRAPPRTRGRGRPPAQVGAQRAASAMGADLRDARRRPPPLRRAGGLTALPSPGMAELRPVALPPAERTVGQLVAESIRFYGEHFWPCLSLGLAPAALAVMGANVSRSLAIVLSPTLFGALLSASF